MGRTTEVIITNKTLEPASINYSANDKKMLWNNIVYLPILKNAHRYVSVLLTAYNFKPSSTVNYNDKSFLVILRDPVERWFAGASQFLYRHTSNLEINNEILELLTHLIVLDGHTRSQINFLNGIDISKSVFFNCDDEDFEEKIQHYCRYTFGGIVDMNSLKPENVNYNTSNPYYIDLKQKMKELCSVDQRARLEKYYSYDYELLNNVKFYRGKND